MGASGEDIQLSEAAIREFNYGVECKNRAAIAVYRDFEQASSHVVGTDRVPLLVIKQNHSEPLAVVSLEHFMSLVKGKNEN